MRMRGSSGAAAEGRQASAGTVVGRGGRRLGGQAGSRGRFPPARPPLANRPAQTRTPQGARVTAATQNRSAESMQASSNRPGAEERERGRERKREGETARERARVREGAHPPRCAAAPASPPPSGRPAGGRPRGSGRETCLRPAGRPAPRGGKGVYVGVSVCVCVPASACPARSSPCLLLVSQPALAFPTH